MFTFLITLILIVAGLLIVAVLLQSSKKEGLGSPFGDMNAAQLIGVQKAGDLLEQVTWGLIIILFTLVIATSVFLQQAKKPSASPNINRAQEHISLPDVPEQTAKPAPVKTTAENDKK